MLWTILFLVAAALAARTEPSPPWTNSTAICRPLPTPDFNNDPALVGIESGSVPYADVPISLPGACEKFEIIVARGVLEAGNNCGDRVGQPLVNRVIELLSGSNGTVYSQNETVAYPVQYPASLSVPEFVKPSIETGIDDVLVRLESQNRDCPNKRFALVGSTMGAEVVRGAGPFIDLNIQPKIVAVVLFSDPALRSCGPPLPPLLQTRLYENCVKGDLFCDREAKQFTSLADPELAADFAPWLLYGDGSPFQEQSAKFIVAAFEGRSLPPRVSGTEPVPPEKPLPTVR